MKKRYMCPMTTTIMAETCSICAGSPPKWAVYPKQDPDESDEPSSWGEIIWDEGTFKKEEDPFDPDNW
nr:hypothetical protein [uncultured Prevotella sp.]